MVATTSLTGEHAEDVLAQVQSWQLDGQNCALVFVIGTEVMETYFSTDVLSTAYGAAGSPVMVLSWVYYMSYIFFCGALFIRAYMRHVHYQVD